MSPRKILGPCHVKSCPNRSDCPEHKRTTSSKDYGAEHQAERAAWQRRMDAGEVVRCRRCKQPIRPGQPWDLGHPAPKHPEHRGHNRATMGRDRA